MEGRVLKKVIMINITKSIQRFVLYNIVNIIFCDFPVSQRVIEEVSAIQDDLEIERICRESAEALASKVQINSHEIWCWSFVSNQCKSNKHMYVTLVCATPVSALCKEEGGKIISLDSLMSLYQNLQCTQNYMSCV